MSDKSLTNGIVTFSKKEVEDYQKYLSSRKEWPGICIQPNKDKLVALNIVMLIMELYRLVPFKEGRYINFHPFNMPYVKIRRIEVVGVVTSIKQLADSLSLTIDDGTGVIETRYRLEQYRSLLKVRQKIDEKYRDQATSLTTDKTRISKECPQKFPDIRPGFVYPSGTSLQDIAFNIFDKWRQDTFNPILENNWWSETKHGLLGKEIQQFDYVYIAGYPCLDARFQQIPEEVTAEFIERARLTIFAMSVMCISQETYNEKLSMWINTIIRQRYK